MTVDVERLLSEWLREQPEITALIGDHVFTEIPRQADYPLIRLTLIGGRPLYSQPLRHDEALIQVDSWGGPKVLARQVIDTTRAVMAERFLGQHALGVVTALRFGELRYLPDDLYDPPKPWYIAEVRVLSHP